MGGWFGVEVLVSDLAWVFFRPRAGALCRAPPFGWEDERVENCEKFEGKIVIRGAGGGRMPIWAT